MYPRFRHPIGGIFVHEQVRTLRARGIDARVASGDPFWIPRLKPLRIASALRSYQTWKPAWTAWDTVPTLHFPYLCGFLFRPSLHSLTYVRGFRRVLAQLRDEFAFDLVHAHTSFLDGAAGRVAADVGKCPLVITEHTGPFELLARNALVRWRTRQSVHAASRVYAVSESLRRSMLAELALAPDRIGVLGNGVDTAVFHPAPADRTRADDVIRVLWVGHYVEIKRVDNLVRAFALALRNRPRLRLSLLGDGPEKPNIGTLVRDLGLTAHVEFLPATDRAGVAAAMHASNFVVISSATETFSLVALEALACGAPVLSTACGGPEDLITEPWLGMIVSNDLEGLTAGLIEMTDRADGTGAAKRSAYVSARFCWDAIAGQLIEAYRDLCS
jgi:glycosyltransferase involved in cell wall biosynthesis